LIGTHKRSQLDKTALMDLVLHGLRLMMNRFMPAALFAVILGYVGDWAASADVSYKAVALHPGGYIGD
jgi:hypothetical protein